MVARSLVPLALSAVLMLGACGSEPTGPVATDDLLTFAKSDASIAVPGTPITSEEECTLPDPPPGTIPWSDATPALRTYCAEFWVTQGFEQSLSMAFVQGTVAKSRWFLRLNIPADAVFVDEYGNPLSNGSVVRVTVAVHPSLYLARFGPHGSGFQGKRPAVLKLDYSWSELGKKAADGLVIYYQADEGSEWQAEPTAIDARNKWVYTYLHHFSNYAVAW